MTVELSSPGAPADWLVARSLIEAYARALNVDLCFQGFDEEIADLPKHYGPPKGAFLIASINDAPIGCVGLRRHADGIAEMKRLYVKPEARRSGAGRLLATKIIEEAGRLGYTRMVLDTLPRMKEAQGLYKSLGFKQTTPYTYNPIPGTDFLELTLA